MTTVTPFHSTGFGEKAVHHNNSYCLEGNAIKRHVLRLGTGNRRLCSNCERLNREGK